MRNFAEITEAEVKAVYDKTPEVNQYHSWESVKKFESLYLILKNKIIAHEQEQEKTMNAIVNPNHQTPFKAVPIGRTVRHQGQQVKPRRSTITLKDSQIEQINSALALARNCLQCNLADAVKNEALTELARAQSTLNSFN